MHSDLLPNYLWIELLVCENCKQCSLPRGHSAPYNSSYIITMHCIFVIVQWGYPRCCITVILLMLYVVFSSLSTGQRRSQSIMRWSFAPLTTSSCLPPRGTMTRDSGGCSTRNDGVATLTCQKMRRRMRTSSHSNLFMYDSACVCVWLSVCVCVCVLLASKLLWATECSAGLR